MRAFIKACGLQNPAEAAAAVAAGCTAIGVLLGLTHRAEDAVACPEQARLILQAAPEGVTRVMVTHGVEAASVADLARACGCGAVQIHGPMPVEQVAALRQALPGVPLVKALHLSRDATGQGSAALAEAALAEAAGYAGLVQAFLVDSRTAERLGGTGLVCDWAAAAAVVRRAGRPVILAGGLNPGNLAEAIRQVKPAGIDANSGLEHADGRKDPVLLEAFARLGMGLL